ncbi:iron siderophore-binding protein [Devosia geojensis]|uniref:Iron siderophore-binding protein n=1 Tax=Devosia geojensis TaxID=443610 RepID=A0A0F5FSM7_9HYPH|nr:iron-siderophore ABC transporter substrate-binding protein [Devosia geojensis]KKB11560.1 iron siderophore-binding protein [Devosia geojensis]
MPTTRTTLATLMIAATFTASAEAREITHAMGVTDVPDNPQRVVVLTNEGTEAVVHLGVAPVGAVQSWYADPWYEHIAAGLAETVPLGTETAVDLERLAALEPDLIIGSKVRQEKLYDQLSAIAPTVFSQTIGGVWRENYELYADALGLAEKGTADLAAFDARVERLREELGPAVEEEISLVRFSPGRTRLYFRDNFPGVILAEIGFTRPAAQDKPGVGEEIGKERISDMAGDRIFYFSDADADSVAYLADWTGEPLWQSLAAVEAGKAHAADNLIWNAGIGIYCAHLLLDDIARAYGVPAP